MTPDVAVALALAVMGHVASRDEAQEWAREAARRGATPAELADAWSRWDRRADEDVHVVEVTGL